MKPFDIVSIGSAVLDTFFKSSAFTPHTVDGEMMLCEVYGGKADVEDALLCSGGAGTNTAVSFARQGYRSAVVAEVGSDTPAQIIFDDLHKEGVDTSFIVEEPDERTGMSAILVSSDGSRSAMTFRGAAKMLTPKDVPFEHLTKTKHIHLSSIGNPDLIRQIFLFCKEKRISLSWNPSKGELQEIVQHANPAFDESCEVIFMNDQEFETVQSKQDVLERLARVVVITKGKKGGEIWYRGRKSEYQAKEVQAVEETGAGDAFASGFVGGYLKTQSIEKATEAGIANSTNVVMYMGAKEGLLKTVL